MSYADNSRHYGFYIEGDIAKLPGGGRRGAAVLCELVPGQLSDDPDPHARYRDAFLCCQPLTIGVTTTPYNFNPIQSNNKHRKRLP